jgi:hypothetical protein
MLYVMPCPYVLKIYYNKNIIISSYIMKTNIPDEIEKILNDLKIKNYEIKTKYPYMWIIIKKLGMLLHITRGKLFAASLLGLRTYFCLRCATAKTSLNQVTLAEMNADILRKQVKRRRTK